MEIELKENLRRVADLYCGASALALTTVFSRAAKDARFLERIESGKGFTIKTYDNIMSWFSDNWPDGAEWPADVARPVAAEPARSDG